MTNFQKNIVNKLLTGCFIVNSKSSGFRVLTQEKHVCLKFDLDTFYALQQYLRKKKNVYVLNKKAIRSLHGGTWIKKQYKKQLRGEQLSNVASIKAIRLERQAIAAEKQLALF